jgi:hypothetical protein
MIRSKYNLLWTLSVFLLETTIRGRVVSLSPECWAASFAFASLEEGEGEEDPDIAVCQNSDSL